MAADYTSSKVSSAETSSATKFDSFVQAVQDALNAIGDTSKMGWFAGQIVDLTQLKQSSATSGQVPTWNGSAWVAATPSSASSFPAGMIVPYGASSAPTGWLACDGTAVSRSTYATLFAVISTAYGVGDGSTTFNLPDLRGRMPVGYASAGHSDVSTLGNNDGSALANRRPKHQHTVYDPTHTHGPSVGTAFVTKNITGAAPDGDPSGSGRISDTATVTGATASGVKVNPAGASSDATSPSNAPAYIALSFIVKT